MIRSAARGGLDFAPPGAKIICAKPSWGGSMQRREALKLLLAGGVLPALPTDVFALFQGPHPASACALRTLTPHQKQTVGAMTDLSIPATDTARANATRLKKLLAR